MSGSVSIETPRLPTSPMASGSSESRPMRVGRSNAVDSPSPPAASRSRNLRLVSGAVQRPPNIGVVHSFDRYIDAYGPRVYGHSPGNSPSSGPYTGATGSPDIVSKSASRRWACSNAACQRSRAVVTASKVPPVGEGRRCLPRPLTRSIGTGPGYSPDANPSPQEIATMEQRQAPDRNLAMELARVTEAAALAAGRWMGRGDKEAADQAAVDAMRLVVNNVSMDGVVVIGEGEKDEAPMLYNGEQIGAGGPPCDIAVDPIDGTTLTALGRPNAIAVIALSERGTMVDPGPCVYMEKIAVGPEAADVIDLEASVTHNLQAVAKALGEDIDDVTAVILERDRHDGIIKECREAGARIRLIPDGDVAGAISTAWPESGANILFGIGGTPEGVIAACALKALGGAMQGRLWPRNDDERQRAIDAGYDLDQVLTTDILVGGDNAFFPPTGITDRQLLHGLHHDTRGPT